MPHSSATVLVVDDEPAIRRFLKSTLEASAMGRGRGRGRRRGDKGGAPPPARGNSSRPGPARPRRHGAAPGAQAPVRCRHPGPHQPGRRAQQGGGPGRRCRRLCHQALQHPRAPGPDAHRTAPSCPGAGRPPAIHAGELTIDLVLRRVARAGEEIKLSPKEWDILEQLALHAGRVVTHDQILAKVWGQATESRAAISAGLPAQASPEA